MSQNRNVSSSDIVDRQYIQVGCPWHETHRDHVTQSTFISKVGSYVSAGRDGTLRVWSPQLQHEHTLPVSERGLVTVQDMATLPGNLAKLVVAGNDRVLSFYELNDLAGSPRWGVIGRLQLKDMPISISSWVHEADGTLCFAVGTDNGFIAIYDAQQLCMLLRDERVRAESVRGAIPVAALGRALVLNLALHKDWVTALFYEPGLSALVSASLDSFVHVTQLDWPPAVAPSSDAAKLATASDPPRAVDASHCRSICSFRAHAKGVTCLQLFRVASRKLCATCSYDRHVCIWNVETSDLLKTLEGHRGLLRQLAYDNTSNILISLSADGEVRFWDVGTYTQLQVLRPQNVLERISSISFNEQHATLVTATCRLMLWQHPRKTATDEVLAATLLAPNGHQHPLVGVLYSYQFFLAITGDESGSICVWDARSGSQVFRFDVGDRLSSMALDATGRKLLTGNVDGAVSLWNFSSGEKLKTASTALAPQLEVRSCAYDPASTTSPIP